MKEKKRVLFCVLDWGLGHATRSIPIIRELLSRGCEVRIASSGSALALLKTEFPELINYKLTGYKPYYSKFDSVILPMIVQVQKFARVIKAEHNEIEAIVARDQIECVIADNRFGCWSASVPSVVITHQVRILLPFWLSWIVNARNTKYLKNFSTCWIPDWPGDKSFCGKMTARPAFPVEYLGPLSRFHEQVVNEKKYEILAVISGPEPQRSILEEKLRGELKKSNKVCMLVRGLPDLQERKREGNVEEVSHLNGIELNRAILESEIVVSRSGYSTVMDLAKLEKRAIFIPTPGQTEQEYLGAELMKRKVAICVKQSQFNLAEALDQSREYSGFTYEDSSHLLNAALDKLLLL